jgi:SAM-dependent methyltransferase
MNSTISLCKICLNVAGNTTHTAREMMFGTRDEFKYIECAKCGCLFIKDIPEDLSQYYTSGYYSMNLKRIDLLKFYFGALILRFCLPFSQLRAILSRLYNISKFEWLLDYSFKKNLRILDVGCGVGKLLLILRHLGFSQLTGVDPFITQDTFYRNGVSILKKELVDLKGQFDFIMLHHSFEHLPDPFSALQELNRLLCPGGIVLIRMPVSQTYAWKRYGTKWAQMDAPRHLFLYSVESFKILADKTGFKIDKLRFDSSAFQIWGSEQSAKNIALMEKLSYKVSPKKSIFSNKDIRGFGNHARQLNDNKNGDQACFYLIKA